MVTDDFTLLMKMGFGNIWKNVVAELVLDFMGRYDSIAHSMLLAYIEMSGFPQLNLHWKGRAQSTFRIEILSEVYEVKSHRTLKIY